MLSFGQFNSLPIQVIKSMISWLSSNIFSRVLLKGLPANIRPKGNQQMRKVATIVPIMMVSLQDNNNPVLWVNFTNIYLLCKADSLLIFTDIPLQYHHAYTYKILTSYLLYMLLFLITSCVARPNSSSLLQELQNLENLKASVSSVTSASVFSIST